jgi:hypothetical protein
MQGSLETMQYQHDRPGGITAPAKIDKITVFQFQALWQQIRQCSFPEKHRPQGLQVW